MRHFLSPAQLRALALMKQHDGIAVREQRSCVKHDWVWLIGDVPKSGPVEALYRAGCVSIDGDRATLTEKGQRIAREHL